MKALSVILIFYLDENALIFDCNVFQCLNLSASIEAQTSISGRSQIVSTRFITKCGKASEKSMRMLCYTVCSAEILQYAPELRLQIPFLSTEVHLSDQKQLFQETGLIWLCSMCQLQLVPQALWQKHWSHVIVRSSNLFWKTVDVKCAFTENNYWSWSFSTTKSPSDNMKRLETVNVSVCLHRYWLHSSKTWSSSFLMALLLIAALPTDWYFYPSAQHLWFRHFNSTLSFLIWSVLAVKLTVIASR